MDWIHEKPNVGMGVPFEAWLDDGSVRTMMRSAAMWFAYQLLDCWHPMQNICCDERRVKAWRLIDG